MKKIWIVLLAFGGVAIAAPTTDLLAPNYTDGSTKAYFSTNDDGYVDLIKTSNDTIKYDFDEDKNDINFALTFSIELVAGLADKPTISVGNGSTASGLTVMTTSGGAITLANGTTSLSVKDSRGHAAANGLVVNTSHTYMLLFGRLDSNDIVINESSNHNVAYLFDLTIGDYIYAEDLVGLRTTLTRDSSKVWTNGGEDIVRLGNVYLIDGLTRSDLVQRAIPEPATATLSLLALAGLAARRRRK